MPALSQSLVFTINSATTVQVDYPNTRTATLTYYSDRIKGDGYYGGSDGFHTTAYKCNPQFVGTVTMQASLATEPVETDWFNVQSTTSTYTALNIRTTSTVDLYNFTGNFVWLRGKIVINQGSVISIKVNN